MLIPNLATQGQFIGESAKGSAFAYRDDGGEYKICGANAQPLWFYTILIINAFQLLIRF
jgi:hypothetical protein